jgi:hypothetical protein
LKSVDENFFIEAVGKACLKMFAGNGMILLGAEGEIELLNISKNIV